MKINGWTILFHPLFDDQWQQLLNLVKSLRSRLSQEDFVQHPQVKLFKALTVGIEEKIPNEPLASYFAPQKPLDKYSRLKKMGLPNRYRLFFKVFPQQKAIVILWLGFPRKDERPTAPIGAKSLRDAEALAPFGVRRKTKASAACTREEEGDKKDCYRVFAKMVKKGQFPLSLKDIIDSDNGQES
ncbi:type II toxin-antitoxin system YhaV family toxin [Pleurocapsales cyanobacterium LEGE 10410]|nr:type II toxin-antitoxin system YhaV family toxin [Pleurocapsales cyanobacterium LEGE 10410]